MLHDLVLPKDFTADLQPHESWMGMYLKSVKLGSLHTEVKPGPEGVKLGQQFRFAVLVQGEKKIIQADVQVRLTKSSELESFEVVADTGFMDVSLKGNMLGDNLSIELTIGDAKTRRNLSMRQSPVVSMLLPMLLAKQNLQPGQRYRLRVFDPLSFTNSYVVVEVVGIEAVDAGGGLVPAYHVRRKFMGRLVDSWIDEQGEILKEEYAQLGLSFRREDPAKAQVDPAGLDLVGDREQVMTWLQALVGGRGDSRGDIQ